MGAGKSVQDCFDICVFLTGAGVVMEMAFYSKLLLIVNVSVFNRRCLINHAFK